MRTITKFFFLLVVGCSGGAGATAADTDPEVMAQPDAGQGIDAASEPVSEDSGLLLDAGRKSETGSVSVGGPDAAPNPDSSPPPTDSGQTTQDAGMVVRCSVGGTAYAVTCSTPRTYSDPNVAYIDWKEFSGAVSECGGACKFGQACTVHWKNGTYSGGVCL